MKVELEVYVFNTLREDIFCKNDFLQKIFLKMKVTKTASFMEFIFEFNV